MGDENPIRTLGDYSKPSHEGYRNTIELPVGNNVKSKKREGNPEDTNTITYIEERRDTPLLERKDIAVVGILGCNKDDEGIEWFDVEEPLDLVDTSEESVYESLIEEMPKC
ncbi:hypothetical protein Tco_1447384 [Tanacetum coccineum]